MAAINGEADDGAICRICHLGDKEKPLIRVCECKGSLQFVHHSCINDWVNKSRIVDCLCGYRLTVRQEKLKIKIPLKELYKKSIIEFLEELSVAESKKMCYIVGACIVSPVLLLILLLLKLSEIHFTGDNQVMASLASISFYGFPLVSYLNMINFLSSVVPVMVSALICVRVLRKMWQNRCVYKLTVKPLD